MSPPDQLPVTDPGQRSPLDHWPSLLYPASTDCRFDPTVPHPARVYDYWLGGYFP